MWDLSVSFVNSSLKFFSGFDEAFKTLKEIGFDAMCPSESIPNGDRQGYIEALTSASKKYGVKINMLHLPIVCEVPTEVFLSEKFFREMVDYIDLAEKIGCKYAVVHPHMPWKREFFPMETKFDYSAIKKQCEEINFEFFRKLQPYALNSGVELSIENIYTSDSEFREQLVSGCSEVDEWIGYIDALGKGFSACLDTGHANLTHRKDEAICEMVEKLGSRLTTLHVNQNYGKFSPYGDFHFPPLLGDIDLVAFAKTLKKTGYKGDFNYEVVLPTVDKELFLLQLKYLKAYTDYLYKLI